MQFSTKDLLVTVLPKAGASSLVAHKCLFRTVICGFPTYCFHRTCLSGGSILCGNQCSYLVSCHGCSIHVTGGCQLFNSCGGPGGSACDPTYIQCYGGSRDPFVIENLEDLVTLKAELVETVRQLEEVEKSAPGGLRSRADAEALERGLNDALDQVRKAKDSLK